MTQKREKTEVLFFARTKNQGADKRHNQVQNTKNCKKKQKSEHERGEREKSKIL